MKNFKSVEDNVDAYRNKRLVKNKQGKLEKKTDTSHFVSSLMQFKVDAEYDVYVMKGYGAFIDNLDVKIEKIDDLKKFTDKKTKKNPYQWVIALIEEGYDIVVGGAFPSMNGSVKSNSVGLYCKNYKDIAEKENQLGI